MVWAYCRIDGVRLRDWVGGLRNYSHLNISFFQRISLFSRLFKKSLSHFAILLHLFSSEAPTLIKWAMSKRPFGISAIGQKVIGDFCMHNKRTGIGWRKRVSLVTVKWFAGKTLQFMDLNGHEVIFCLGGYKNA